MGESFTHFDEKGNAIMVDVSQKNETARTAIACGSIRLVKKLWMQSLIILQRKAMYLA